MGAEVRTADIGGEGQPSVADLREEFDAVYIASGPLKEGDGDKLGMKVRHCRSSTRRTVPSAKASSLVVAWCIDATSSVPSRPVRKPR